MCLAVPGRVISSSVGGDGMPCGAVDFEGVVREISFVLVPDVKPGDYVIAQMGMALEVLTEAEALQQIADLKALRQDIAAGWPPQG